jgi:hypothetical protein
MRKNQQVAEMADKVLARQAVASAVRTGERFKAALDAVVETEAGRQLEELREGSHRDERAQAWQEDLLRERTEERRRKRGRRVSASLAIINSFQKPGSAERWSSSSSRAAARSTPTGASRRSTTGESSL